MSDAQQPHAWAVQGCTRMWTGEFAEADAKAEAARYGGTCYAYPLFREMPKPDAQKPVVEPDFWTACALHEGGGDWGWIPLPGYSNETAQGVKNLVLQDARKENYKGTVTGRLMELGWEVRPVYLARQKLTLPDEWAEAVKQAEYVKEKHGLTKQNFMPELAQAIIDMDAKLKGLK